MTRRNKLLGAPLSILISALFCFGIFFIIRSAVGTCKSFDCLFVRVWAHSASSATVARDKSRSVQDLLLQTLAERRAHFH